MKKNITPSKLILLIVLIILVITLGSIDIMLLAKESAPQVYNKARNLTAISMTLGCLSYGIYIIVRYIENQRKDGDK